MTMKMILTTEQRLLPVALVPVAKCPHLRDQGAILIVRRDKVVMG
jgi:hypothetical protein